MYTDEQQRIIDRLNEFIDEQPSQNKAAELLGISASILTSLRKGTYKGTVDKYFNKLAAYFNIKSDLGSTHLWRIWVSGSFQGECIGTARHTVKIICF